MAYKSPVSFLPFTDAQAENYLSTCMPPGKLTAKRYDSTSNLYNLLYCLADFIKQISIQFYTFVKNLNINTAVELLPELEASVGIPTLIPRIPQGSMTLSQWYTARQNAVAQLKSKIPVYNIASVYNIGPNGTYTLVPNGWKGDIRTTFENYVYVLTGITISISIGNNTSSSFPLSFPFSFATPYWQLPLIWTINVHGITIAGNNSFPFTFPGVFGTSTTIPAATQALLTTVLERVIPSYIAYSFLGVQ